MRSLLRWSALAAALQLFLTAAVAHSAPGPKALGPKGCTSTNVALFEAPTPSCSSTLEATVGTPITFTVKAGDADAGDVVELGVTGLPAGAQLSTALPASGNPVSTDFTWTPAVGDTGSHVIMFTAFDGCAAGPTQCSVTVHVAGGCSSTNVALFEAPTPSCSSTLQATVGTPLTFTVKAGDADAGDTVELGVTGLPAGAQLSTALPASGNPVSTDFTWTPAVGDTGSHVITFTAFDGCAAGPTQCAFTVHVSAGSTCSPTNVALFVSPTPSCGSTLEAIVGTPLTFTVKAADADTSDTVELGVTGLPAGAQLSPALPASENPVSTDFSWTPAVADTGSHVITFTAFDGCAAGPTQCSFTVHVIDNRPPDCSAAFVANSEIWPPNGRMVPVHIQGIEDPDGDPFTIHVTDVTQDEDIGSGDGSCNASVDKDGNVSVRARRDGGGNGRVYHVTFVATDENGASCEGSVELCVPHDQGRHNECVDDGQNFHVSGDCFAEDDGDDGGNGGGNGDAKGKIDLKVTQVSAGVAQVEYTLPAEAQMSLSVYNVAGRRIATILEGRRPAGTGSAQWVVTNPGHTVYFVQLRSGDQSVAKRIFLFNR